MAATYHNISRDEFESVLGQFGEFSAVRVHGTREIVYEFASDHDDVSVRVFSTLKTKNGDARDVGSDAIRVVVWDHHKDRPVVSATRTHRIDSWADNIAPKIDAMMQAADAVADDLDDESRRIETALAALPIAGDDDDTEIVVTDVVDTRFGRKLVLDSPFSAKDVIKALDWDRTHRAWDRDLNAWTVDAVAIVDIDEHLANEGFRLVKADPDADDDIREQLADVTVDEHITLTYETKQTRTEKTVRGVVTDREYEGFRFTRDRDNHVMFVKESSLYTAGSHYPYVGNIIAIER